MTCHFYRRSMRKWLLHAWEAISVLLEVEHNTADGFDEKCIALLVLLGPASAFGVTESALSWIKSYLDSGYPKPVTLELRYNAVQNNSEADITQGVLGSPVHAIQT